MGEQLAGLTDTVDDLTRLLADDDHPAVPAQRATPDAGAAPSLLDRLTARESEVAELLSAGLTNRRIARTLSISEPTVKNHLHAIYLKLGVTDRGRAISVLLGGPSGTGLGCCSCRAPDEPRG
ncbi:helix-turn-helix transcriptional regulator [Streptomyces sp. A7024]|uniref:Helix-turn-helix transcriptional regulator n=2 Tax=Streptomyces coryli TaxID=1128680 RepID=A0A6G4U0F1_9ACTN|nr:helix-turn-helix transcriptional regulator [Streptomyces coryli]